MRTSQHTVTVETFTSEVDVNISTTDPRMAEVIAWADENPKAYDIVTTHRSKAWGMGSIHYFGFVQNSRRPEAVLGRLATLRRHWMPWMREALVENSTDLFQWSALYTFAHWNRTLKGGFFQQHARWTDGQIYARHCTTLDYTSDTLEEVIDRFLAWCGTMYMPTIHVTLDGKTVRQVEPVAVDGFETVST